MQRNRCVLLVLEQRRASDHPQMTQIELLRDIASQRCVMNERDASMDGVAVTAQLAMRDNDGRDFGSVTLRVGIGYALEQNIALR